MSTLPYTYLASDLIKTHHSDTLRLFDNLLDAGICREQARGVLPQSMYTQYYGTVNLNNLIKFIILRDDDHAQWEIKQVARACKKIAIDLWPSSMETFDSVKK